MILSTHCQDCRQPITVKLPDTISDGDAQAIAARLFCLPCAVHRMAQITEAAASESDSLNLTIDQQTKGNPMNEKTPAVTVNIPQALATLAELTAMLTALANQDRQNKRVSISEPQSPTARFGSAAADSSRALAALMQAIDELIQESQLNQQLLNLLTAIRADAKRFMGTLANTTLDITGTVHEFNDGTIQPTPHETIEGDEWKSQ